jgi:hypothetical protein
MQAVETNHPDQHPFPLNAAQILTLGCVTMAVTAIGSIIAAVIAYPDHCTSGAAGARRRIQTGVCCEARGPSSPGQPERRLKRNAAGRPRALSLEFMHVPRTGYR